MNQRVRPVNCCGVILSGGLNSRMGGRNKALLVLGGTPILDRIIGILDPFFKELLLVTREPRLYEGRPVKIVEDIYRARASLTGIHAGLTHARAGHAFVVACDAPFLEPALIEGLIEEVEPDKDVIVPVFEGRYEPLCAVYSRRCIPFIEAQLDRGDYKIIRFYDKIRLKPVPYERLATADPRRRSFFNVNTPEAYRRSREFVKENQKGPAPGGGGSDSKNKTFESRNPES